MTHNDLTLITCSYGPDYERCKRLCATVDRYIKPDIEHLLIVPQRDLGRFYALRSPRRRVITVEEVVPGHFLRLPLSERWWVSARGFPVRGWIMQQITKLSVNFVAATEHVMFVDSDIQFIRALEVSTLFNGTKLRLHQRPGFEKEGRHLTWHNRAAQLLGIPTGYQGADYVGQLITWKCSNLTALQHHIESVRGRPWYSEIASSVHFSEYLLYGIFVDKVLGIENGGHYASDREICHCCWFQEQADAMSQGASRISPSAVALLLQSNLNLSLEEEARLSVPATGLSGLEQEVVA